MYSNRKSQLCINGLITNPFPITRSVRRDCPLSMQLFVIGTQNCVKMIRVNTKIHGYNLPNGKEKKIAYADYITIIISNEKSIPEVFETFPKYSLSAGAFIN